MKITRNDVKEIEFGTLNIGDVFSFDSEIFIRIDSIDPEEGDRINAINLENGGSESFMFTRKVKKLKAELIVE